MNDKKNLQDIVESLASQTDFSKQVCEDFVRVFFDSIADSLDVDGIAKIKGLGTFKLINVEERKSVNVQTGESILIQAHRKVTFTPDKTLKDLVNSPFAHLQTYIVKPDAPLDPPEMDEELDELDEKSQDEQNQDNHSGWFDDWEVEYEESAKSEYNNDSVDSAVTSVVENVQSNEMDNSVVAEKNIDVVDQNIVEGNVVSSATEMEEDVVDKSEIEETDNTRISETSTSEDVVDDEYAPNETSEEKTAEDDASSDEQTPTVDIQNCAGESVEEKPLELEDNAYSEEQSNEENLQNCDGESVEDNPLELVDDAYSDEQSNVEDIKNGDGEPAVEVNPVAESIQEESPTIEDPFKKKHKKEEEIVLTPEEEKKKKKLGAGVLAFVIILVSAIIGLLLFSPELFDSMRKTDADEDLAWDTTSVMQEYSDLAESKMSSNDEIESNSENLASEASDADVEESNHVAEQTVEIDQHFDEAFVEYMKENHKNVKLSTSGEPSEITIVKGLFLTQVSQKFYGDKKFWIYLYLYNKDRIKNPNNVMVNTVVRVPQFDKSLVNANDEKSLELASEIRAEFLNKK